MGPFTQRKSRNHKEASKDNSFESHRKKIKNDERNLKLRPKLIDKSVDSVTELGLKESFVILEKIDLSLLNDIDCNHRVVFGDKTNTCSNSSKNMPKASGDILRNRNSNISQKEIGMDSPTLQRRVTRQSPNVSAQRRVKESSSKTSPNVQKNSKTDPYCSLTINTGKPEKLCDQILNSSNLEPGIDSTVHADAKDTSSTPVSVSYRSHCLFESSPTSYDNGHPGNFNVDISPSRTSGYRLRNKNKKSANESSFMTRKPLISAVGKESTCSSNLKSPEKNIMSVDNFESNILSSDSKCVYSKVTRDTLNNKNMPPEEKLALYEFEVDENEPVVKRKKKRKVYVKCSQKPTVRKKKFCDVPKIPAPKVQTQCLSSCTLSEKATINPVSTTELHSSSHLPGKHLDTSIKVCSQKVKENVTELHTITVQECNDKGKKVTKTVHDIHSEKHVHFEETTETENDSHKSDVLVVDTGVVVKDSPVPFSIICHEQLFPASPMPLTERQVGNIQTSKSATRKPVGRMRKRYREDDQENMSPIARPQCRRTPMRKLRVFNQVDSSKCESPVKENSEILEHPATMHSFEQDIITEEVFESPNKVKDSHPVNACNVSNVSDSVLKGLGHSTPAKDLSQSSIVDLDEKRNFISPIPVTRSPSFTPYKGHKTGSTVNSSLNCSVNNQPVPLIRKVFLLPRVSGSGNTMFEKETEKKWDVENCFGFDDECEESELSSTPKALSVEKSTSASVANPIAISSKPTPTRTNVKRKLDILSENKSCSETKSSKLQESTSIATPIVISSKPTPIRTNVKSKLDILSENKSYKSPKLLESKENNISTPCPTFSNPSAASPFSNPLKQSTLDFSLWNPKTPKPNESSTMTESPVLFKDDDKTPTHFTEPPRRSYNRLHRKNLKYIGDDWIEVDEDEHEENKKTKSKKLKKHKRNKEEEKEAQKWIKDFNHQCEEVEDFELCVE